MQTIKYLNYYWNYVEEISVSDYIKHYFCGKCKDLSKDTNRTLSKEQLVNLAKNDFHITIKKHDTKDSIYNEILKQIDELDLAEKYKIGIYSYQFKVSFGILKGEVKYLEKIGKIKLIDVENRKNQKGEEYEVSKYDIKQFVELSVEQVHEWLKDYRKEHHISDGFYNYYGGDYDY